LENNYVVITTKIIFLKKVSKELFFLTVILLRIIIKQKPKRFDFLKEEKIENEK
jgi:hypothetical protein